jgi:CubicO group peptidase (beta-lactamase class C family)
MRLLLLLSLAACSPSDPPVGGKTTADDTGEADTGTDPLDPRFEAIAAAVAADLEDNLATGASISIWLDGEVQWVGGFGSAHPDHEQAVGPDTLFMIGSDTKKLTAISLLQRVAEGSTTLDTTLGEVVPELEMAWAPAFTGATVHELLTHQGGIVDMIEQNTSSDGDGLLGFTLGDFAEQAYPLAPPGRIWNYSNPNFSIAGLLDQQLAGQPWEDQIQAGVLTPLGMDRTITTLAGVDADAAAGFGYTQFSGGAFGTVEVEDSWETAWTRPAGLLWSNSLDQARLAAFLVEGDEAILPADLHAALHGAQVPVYPETTLTAYGYGLMVDRGLALNDGWHDVPVWSHGGNTVTHTSTFYVLPEQRFAISVLSNGYGDNFSRSVVAAIESLVTDLPEASPAPSMPFDATELDGLTGRYLDGFNVGEIIVSREGDSLIVEAPLLDEYAVPYDTELQPLATRLWLWGIQGTTVDLMFIDGPEGEAYLRNRSFVAIRSPDAPVGPAARQPAPRLDLARLADPVPPLLRPSPVRP